MKINQLLSTIFLALLGTSTIVLGQNNTTFSINGIWQSEGYGQIVSIDDQTVQLYDICSLNCTPKLSITKESFYDEFEVKTVTETTLTLRESTTEYDFKKLAELPDLCQRPEINKKNDPLYNFETLCTTLEAHYCYFDTRNIDWDAMKAKYQAQITPKTKPLELFIIMDKMLTEFKDGHVTMFVPDELQNSYAKYQKKAFKKKKKANKGKSIGINTETIRHALVDKYVKDKQVYNAGAVLWGLINEDLVLVQINGMDELANYNIPKEWSAGKAMKAYEKEVETSKNYTQDVINGAGQLMDEILKKAKNAKAIILDIRLNGGGYDGAGMEILRRFIDKEIVVLTKKAKNGSGYTRSQPFTLSPTENTFSKQVFILTSPHTASAAESFTLAAMEAIPDAIRIGDKTRGIFSDRLEKKLPNGWEYGLSNEVYESMKGVSYEGIGIEPHHKIPFKKKSTFWVFHQLMEELERNNGDAAIEMILKMDLAK